MNRRTPKGGPLVSALVALAVLLFSAGDCRASAGIRRFSYMVPMQDGTRLATDVYLPRLPRSPCPIVLVRTLDGRSALPAKLARYVCRHGFGLVVQDTRGRHGSEGGDRLVFVDDGWVGHRDGHATLSWIARQSWCDGRIGAWGVSSIGAMANMLAPDAPPELKAQHVMMAFSDMFAQAAYQGGALRKSLVETWLSEGDSPQATLDALRRDPCNSMPWDDLRPEAQAGRVNAPGVFWGGWYDIFLQGTINSFTAIHNRGGPGARGRCRLIIGPWSHGDAVWLLEPRHAGCRPEAADPLRFFNYYLKCMSNGVPDDAAVHYYVMGDEDDPAAPGNRWRTADNWPPPAAAVRYYFHPDGTLRREVPATAGAKQAYRFDPTDPAPTCGGQNLRPPYGAMDQRSVESRGDVLLFTTPPLAEAVEVAGRIEAELHVSSDCPDTDFTVKLTDVYPDGRSMLLCDGILRARYRESFKQERLMEPGRVYRLKVDLWSTAVAFNRGHRIRAAVSSSNFPRFEPNPNTGRLPRENAETRVAQNTIHLSPEHPSHIILPVCRQAAGGEAR